ncbi:DUF6660 family protein [Sinomicrobium soli]|uniref:DUF6660 family protein n=1 Tax=Sinomicrobium sp. N-1-3-6 TaxID=2219864 RepID=UPI000DCC02C9|nr:DUF6660 family protein [Sinomicrobium sp. N-1-3-6]RAV27580.1 hypothetical protein DN748_18000 [Sinomicrobium sp. N-1-3-6]
MQKTLTVILSLYLLALAVMPCADRAEPDSHATVLTEAHCDAGSAAGHLECSPLCVCACCGIVVSVEELPVFPGLYAAEVFTDNFSHYTLSPKGYYPSLLQPPRTV